MLKNLSILFIFCLLTIGVTAMVASDRVRPSGPVADFSFTDMNGNSGTLHGLNGPVVLHFWATWCAPCIDEMPKLIRKANATPGTTYLLISVDRDQSLVREFFFKMTVKAKENTRIIHDPSMAITADLFKISRFPESLFLSADKKKTHHAVGPREWQ